MYYFIVNPNSGSGSGLKTWQTIEKILTKKRVEYEAYLTDEAGDAITYAAELSAGNEEKTITVVGGDGTFREVLDGLDLDSPVTLGYIPVGVGNDLARSLRMRGSASKRMKRILKPKYYRYLDYGVLTYEDGLGNGAEHRRFIVSCGIGLDAEICHAEDNSALKPLFGRIHLKKLSGFFARTSSAIKASPCTGYILLDGERRVEFNNIYMISAQLQPYECGGLRMAAAADGSDGMMEVCVLSHSRRKDIISSLLRARIGSRKIREFRIYPCRDLKIHVDEPRLFHADGESDGILLTDLEVSCIPRRVRMIF